MRVHAIARVEIEIDTEAVVDLNSEVGRVISDALHTAGCAHAGTALESLRYHGLSGELSYRGGSVGLGPLT